MIINWNCQLYNPMMRMSHGTSCIAFGEWILMQFVPTSSCMRQRLKVLLGWLMPYVGYLFFQGIYVSSSSWGLWFPSLTGWWSTLKGEIAENASYQLSASLGEASGNHSAQQYTICNILLPIKCLMSDYFLCVPFGLVHDCYIEHFISQRLWGR